MLPEITNLEFKAEETETTNIGKSFLFDFEKGQFILRNGKLVPVEGIEALKVWINKTIRTEKYRFKVYEGTEYGITLEDLIGSNLPQKLIEMEIKREVTEGLLKNPLITGITNWMFTRNGSTMTISFKVISPLGESEVTYIA